MGTSCTFTKEDAPELWELLRHKTPEDDGMTFEITPDHMRLVERMYWGNYDDVPSVDPKRPYGNSAVNRDIAEILGWIPEGSDANLSDDMVERAEAIHQDMPQVMQIITSTLSCRAGTYRKTVQYSATSWERVEDDEW